jgi:hypothetical protein
MRVAFPMMEFVMQKQAKYLVLLAALIAASACTSVDTRTGSDPDTTNPFYEHG